MTSAKRIAELPDVPTMTEAGYPQVGFDPDVWQAFVAPKGTPDAVIRKLNAAVKDSLQTPEVKAAFAKLTFNPMIKTPEEFASFLEAQGKKWPPVIKAANIRPQ